MNNRTKWLSLTGFCLFAFALSTITLGQDEESKSPEQQIETQDAAEKDEPELTPSAKVSALKSALREQVSDLAEQYADAENDEARDAIVKLRRIIEKKHVDELLTVVSQRDNANRNIRDLVWFVSRTKGIARESLYQELIGKYSDSMDLASLVKALGRNPRPDEQVEAWLNEIIQKSPLEKVQGAATYELVGYLTKLQSSLGATDRATASDYLKRRSEGELDDEIERLLKQCVEQYATTKYGRATIGGLAKSQLAQMNLKVGRIAPDIVGVDLDDIEFKLSDYRGKVVMIDFWGDW